MAAAGKECSHAREKVEIEVQFSSLFWAGLQKKSNLVNSRAMIYIKRTVPHGAGPKKTRNRGKVGCF